MESRSRSARPEALGEQVPSTAGPRREGLM